MSKELATTSDKGGIVKYDATNNPFLAAASGVGDFFGSRLSFDGNTGKIHIGPKDDDEELKDKTPLVANLIATEMGAQCWVNSELIEEVIFPIASGRPLPILNDLPDHGPYEKYDDGTEDGWQHFYKFQLYHEKTGEAYTFSTSSKSGIRGVKTLMKAFGSKFPMKIGEDGQYQYPIVEFTSASFKIKDKPKLGKKYAPIFNILEWIDASEALPYFSAGADGEGEEDYEDETEEKAKPRGRAAKDSGEKAKPATRGRGRAAKDSGEKAKPATRAAKRDEDSGEKEEKTTRSRSRDADSGEKEERSSRSRSRDADSGEKEERSSRSRSRDADSGEKEEKSSRSRSRDADSGEKEEKSSRSRGRDADSGEKDDTAGRRTRVRHAEPQDDDDEVDSAVERRTSARARRGRG